MPEKWVDKLLKSICASGSFDKLHDGIQDLMLEGFSVAQLISQIHDNVVASDELSDQQKTVICERIAIVESRLMDGANENLQMLDLASVIMNALTKA